MIAGEWLAMTLRNRGDGVIALDAEGHIVLTNPEGEEYLALLTNADEGNVLTDLAGRPLEELLSPLASGEMHHELVLEGPPRRVFAVVAQPVTAGALVGGWVLTIWEVAEAREVQGECIQSQERWGAVIHWPPSSPLVSDMR